MDANGYASRRVSAESNYPSIFEKDEFLQCCSCLVDINVEAAMLECDHKLCKSCAINLTVNSPYVCPICGEHSNICEQITKDFVDSESNLQKDVTNQSGNTLFGDTPPSVSNVINLDKEMYRKANKSSEIVLRRRSVNRNINELDANYNETEISTRNESFVSFQSAQRTTEMQVQKSSFQSTKETSLEIQKSTINRQERVVSCGEVPIECPDNNGHVPREDENDCENTETQ